MSTRARATRILQRLERGDRSAEAELFDVVHDELKRIASRLMTAERREHTLQPTALVHEAWLRLLAPGGAGPRCRDQAHFLCTAARAMRNLLVDHARSRATKKRGGALQRVALEEVVGTYENSGIDLLALDEGLTALHEAHAQLAQVVELRFFTGLSSRELAEVLDIDRKTAERKWLTARAFLRRYLVHELQ